MSYEVWQKIWQQQVAPRLAVNLDPQVLLSRVKEDSDLFERDWRKAELRELALFFAVVLICCTLTLVEGNPLIRFGLLQWIMVFGLVAYSAGFLTHWFFGRNSASDSGDSLRDVVARATTRRNLHLKLIRFRHGAGLLMLSSYASVGLVGFIGGERDLDAWCSFYIFATVFIFLVWAGFQKHRTRCKELQARIAELEKLRAELAASDESGNT